MKAKEKAKDIVEKYLNQPINFLYVDSADGQCIGAGYMTYRSAISCALISIDELIDELQSYNDLRSTIIIDGNYTTVIGRLLYLNEIIDELEKL